ncbi:Rrf2 family transcriptional regulator [Campylobacter sp. FMV-PI01]|uniref:Rrf2 family transcriptional regulator n=1 Tax=Campylobacter portucalensis TaxID=2608384 RepID=A0A6L5WMS7_9BACT|nr:Rrf2 family transcriptional regulator [Campylobacter portucalensis]MSN96971.1 Rrf2 family transcriptional regulator [Campylobacter portucalensis]
MLFTKASEYALFSLIFIAKKSKPQDVDTISKELEISKSFLAKILQNMAKDGILNSFKGVKGGFALARDRDKINLKEIINSAERHEATVFECSISIEDCPKKNDKCEIWSIFNSLQLKVDDFLDTITLDDIINKRV